MDNLKEIRNELLSLHKTLLEIERGNYEVEFGKITNIQLLNLLFEHQNFLWLREISSLVAEIDELFSARKGLDESEIEKLFLKSKSLFDDSEDNSEFKNKYQVNLDTESVIGKHHDKLESLFKIGKA